jgi:protein ImuA
MSRSAPLLWCQPAHAAAESGRPYGPGLLNIGLDDPSALIIVETGNATAALWAMEEGLGSGSLAAVLGQIEEVDLTQSRRLSLASEAHQTPAIVVSRPQTAGVAAVLTRWRVTAAPSAPHPFDHTLPGNPRCRITPERCRHGAPEVENLSFTVEWCDETLRFRVAAGLADLPALPRRAGRGTG